MFLSSELPTLKWVMQVKDTDRHTDVPAKRAPEPDSEEQSHQSHQETPQEVCKDTPRGRGQAAALPLW